MTITEKPASALYDTIQTQPDEARAVLEGQRVPIEGAIDLLSTRQRIFLAGTGTSSHAAVVGEHLLRRVGIDAYGTTNLDFVNYGRPLTERDALIAISHRGTKTYGKLAIERARVAGIPVVGLTGKGSGMEGATVVILTAPQEASATHTASYPTLKTSPFTRPARG